MPNTARINELENRIANIEQAIGLKSEHPATGTDHEKGYESAPAAHDPEVGAGPAHDSGNAN